MDDRNIKSALQSSCDTEKFVLALNTATDGDEVCYEKFLDDQTLFKQQRKVTETLQSYD